MISYEKILEGLILGDIVIQESKGGCLGLCCTIGTQSFYFSNEDVDTPVRDYLAKHDNTEIARQLVSVIGDRKTAEENGLDEYEYDYFCTVLGINL